jgi:hypothetical protein
LVEELKPSATRTTPVSSKLPVAAIPRQRWNAAIAVSLVHLLDVDCGTASFDLSVDFGKETAA